MLYSGLISVVLVFSLWQNLEQRREIAEKDRTIKAIETMGDYCIRIAIEWRSACQQIMDSTGVQPNTERVMAVKDSLDAFLKQEGLKK